MNIKIVIGSAYGDEGKGRSVSFFAENTPNSMVVRFNGGAQAAHRCVVNGIDHIFKHFGAGTLSNRPTFLTKDFLVNPILLFAELEELQAKGINPKLYMDDCIVTTPYDMMINQWIEEDRGNTRHGSCGLGINETVTRTESGCYSLRVLDLLLPSLKSRLVFIRNDYTRQRCEQMGISLTKERMDILYDERILENFHTQCKNIFATDQFYFAKMENMFKESEAGRFPKTFIFEGAQGLLLDQTHGTFPFVTRSNTGLTNIMKYLDLYCSVDTKIEVFYVTRCYATRHGNGPFDVDDNFPTIVDPCNQPNPWQGTMRFGWLNVDLLSDAIYNDSQMLRNSKFSYVKFKLNITCLDQISTYKLNGCSGIISFDDRYDFVNAVSQLIPKHIKVGYLSDSETGPMKKWKKINEQKRQNDTQISV